MKTTNSILALLAIASLGMTGNASAFTKSYSKTSGSSTLGAELAVEAHDKSTTTSYDLSASASGTAKVIGFNFKVIEGVAGAGIALQPVKNANGTVTGYTLSDSAHADLVLKACGIVVQDVHRKSGTSISLPSVASLATAAYSSSKTLFSEAPSSTAKSSTALFSVAPSSTAKSSTALFSVNPGLSATLLSVTPISVGGSTSTELVSLNVPTKVKEVTFASVRFMVGPIPVRVKAGASASIGAHGALTLVKNNGVPSLKANFGPSADVALVASAGIDAGVASCGIEAKATLIKVSPTAFANLNISPTFTTGSVAYGADLTYQGVNGSINLFAKVDVWLYSHKWTKTLASFGDSVHTLNLIQGNAQLWNLGSTKVPTTVPTTVLTLVKSAR